MASSSSGKALPTGKIRDLTPTIRPPPLEVIVTRTWDVQVSNADTLDFIIMDTNSDQIHEWIPRRLAATYEQHMFENSILRMRGFNVIDKKNKYYSPLKNQYNIVFTKDTEIEPMEEYVRFPQQPFKFTDFADLQPLIGQKSYLPDVIGMFEHLGQAKQVSSTKRLREVFIRNERDQVLRINFWDGNIALIPPLLASDGSTQIVAVTSTTVSNFGGTINVNISQGTKVFVNPDIPPAAELREKIKTPSPGRPEKRLLPSDTIRTIRDVRTALAKGTMGFNLCKATIQQVYEEPDERFRLQLQVGDRYGVLNVAAFGESASEILDLSLEDMNAISEKPETGKEEVRAEIMKIIGKEYLFRIKIDDYNLKESRESIDYLLSLKCPSTTAEKNEDNHNSCSTTIIFDTFCGCRNRTSSDW